MHRQESTPLRYTDVARLLGVSTRTVERLVELRKIKAHRIGRSVRFWPVDVERFKSSAATKNF